MTSPNEDDPLLMQIAVLLPEIPGWCSFDKARKLVETIRSEKPRVCVEIGVFGGSSLIPQALALSEACYPVRPRGVLYGIDPWSTDAALEAMVDPANRTWWSGVSLDDIRKGCQALVDRFAGGSGGMLRDYCRLLQARAEDVVQFFDDGSIDLLHIDGNHSEEKSVMDVELYLPKVRSGGVVFFDDASWSEGGTVTTRRAQDMLAAVCERVGSVGDCLIFKKKSA